MAIVEDREPPQPSRHPRRRRAGRAQLARRGRRCLLGRRRHPCRRHRGAQRAPPGRRHLHHRRRHPARMGRHRPRPPGSAPPRARRPGQRRHRRRLGHGQDERHLLHRRARGVGAGAVRRLPRRRSGDRRRAGRGWPTSSGSGAAVLIRSPLLTGAAAVVVAALAVPGMVAAGSHSHAGGHGDGGGATAMATPPRAPHVDPVVPPKAFDPDAAASTSVASPASPSSSRRPPRTCWPSPSSGSRSSAIPTAVERHGLRVHRRRRSSATSTT